MLERRIIIARTSSISMAEYSDARNYARQKDDLREAIQRILAVPVPFDFDVQRIARLMHHLARISACFGEDHVGECAARLDHPLRVSNDADDIKSLCAQMLTVLG